MMKIKYDEVVLSFCQDCEVLRLRDVKAQLQQLFTEKTILPDFVCAICGSKSASSPEQRGVVAGKVNWGKESTTDKHSPKSSETQKLGKRRKTVPDDEHWIDAEKVDCPNKRKSDVSRIIPSQGDDAQHEERSDDDVIVVSNSDSQSRGGGDADDDEASSDETTSGFDVISGTKVDIDGKTTSHHQMPELMKNHKKGDLPRIATRLSTGAIIVARQDKLKTNESEYEENRMISSGGEDDLDANDDDDYVDTQSDSNVEEVDSDDDPDDKKQTLVKTEQKEGSAVVKKPLPPYDTAGINPEILAFTIPSDDPERPFKCKLCIKMYSPYLSTFQLHIKTHNGKGAMQKPFKCDVCGNDYKSNGLLNSHKVVHHSDDGGDKFKCSYRNCKYNYTNKRDLKCHLEVHRGIKRHQCETCGLGFSTTKRLAIHQTKHTGHRSFPCKDCDRTFSHPRLLLEHHYIHRFKCDQCDYTCRARSTLMAHKTGHDERRDGHFVCERCRQVFKYQRWLDKHRALDKCKPPKPPAAADDKHPQLGDVDIDISGITKWLNPKILDMMDNRPRSSSTPFKCKLCSAAKEFQKVNSFLKHMRLTHSADVVDKPYKCNICPRDFTGYSKLKVHLTTHSNIKHFACHKCDKKFKNIVRLNVHKKTHEPPEKMCSVCGARFISTSKLKLHVARVHLGLRPYKCDHCHKSFSVISKMKTHVQRRHRNDSRPWMCDSCGKSFKVIEDLRTHSHTHSSVKKYSCDVCDYRCIRADYLQKHRRVHTGAKPYRCGVCEMRFSNRTSLVLHQNKNHGGMTVTMATV